MMRLKTLAVCAFMAPAITFSIGSAMAESSSSEHGDYLSNRLGDSFLAEELIGSELMKSNMGDSNVPASGDSDTDSDSEAIGTISDLLIDEEGQILAVIVDVGGLLGVGAKEVAISWDSVEQAGTRKIMSTTSRSLRPRRIWKRPRNTRMRPVVCPKQITHRGRFASHEGTQAAGIFKIPAAGSRLHRTEF